MDQRYHLPKRGCLSYIITQQQLTKFLSAIRQRLPLDVFEQVFAFVLSLVKQHGLLKGQTVGVDSTLLEANAAMKSIVRRGTGEDWEAYVLGLAEADGVEINSDDDLRKFDRKRKGKKASNQVFGDN